MTTTLPDYADRHCEVCGLSDGRHSGWEHAVHENAQNGSSATIATDLTRPATKETR